MSTLAHILGLIPFYLIGSFPSGHLIAKAKGVDISKAGSGNVGATNVARVLGRRAGIYTLLLDVLKGMFAVWLAAALTTDPIFVGSAAVIVVAGHCFSIPPWLKGGKGVATAFGSLLFLCPPAALFGLAVFVLSAVCFRIVSVSSIAAALTAPVFALLTRQPDWVTIPLGLIALLIVIRHGDNLERLSQGREGKISFSKKS